VAAASLVPVLTEGWVPFDEGTLAQSAHRVLLGQLPHRDFDDVYTGGLSFFHAAAFHSLGENLVTLRVVLFVAVLAAAPVVYYVASRFARPAFAAAVSSAVLLVSFPSYPAGMPSWYNLILALFGTAAVLRFVEVGTRRWLLAAGVITGLSVLIKVVGLFLGAGLGLTLVYHAFNPATTRERPVAGCYIGVAAVVPVLALAFAPFAIMWRHLRLAESLELGAPVAAMCFAAASRVWSASARGAGFAAWRKLGWLLLPFGIGVAIPILVFLAPYVRAEAVDSLFHGVFVLPQLRLQWTAIDGPPAFALLLGIPPVALLVSTRFSASRLRRYDVWILAAGGAALVAWSARSLEVTAALWNMVRMAAPMVVFAAAGLLVARRADEAGLREQQLFAMASVAAWSGLIQFPTDSYQYFLYVLPLFVLTAGFLAGARNVPSTGVAAVVLGLFMALGLFLRPVFIHGGGSHVVLAGDPAATLDVARGGLTIRRAERDEYVRVASIIQAHSRSRYIYVSPDAPEVYFLSERENPTRTLFDFFDDPRDRTSRVLRAIRSSGADVAVINKAPRFSRKLPADLYDSLTARYPSSTVVGLFEIRW
jgi:hypothetical protein